ncbi:hypothetical protein NF212_02675 [Parasalinivibrio latis]|uniref:protein YgfX n=1 Tax=Parasalinivibrio latis TaxID=2952610 RepID=UPI0030E42810
MSPTTDPSFAEVTLSPSKTGLILTALIYSLAGLSLLFLTAFPLELCAVLVALLVHEYRSFQEKVSAHSGTLRLLISCSVRWQGKAAVLERVVMVNTRFVWLEILQNGKRRNVVCFYDATGEGGYRSLCRLASYLQTHPGQEVT